MIKVKENRTSLYLLNHIDISGCSNSDYRKTDKKGRGCQTWYDYHPETCGDNDDDDFEAKKMCCACKKGFKLYRIMILIDWK